MTGKPGSQWMQTGLNVTISFSREEWEVLAEWQKELYREVMKENCASLISLGKDQCSIRHCPCRAGPLNCTG
uniref:KRAB domain-containing protein n=1 Tax=Gopherus evgoodei TaxID=1825980 RepID=A0A8C4VPY5_9SAUR